MKKIIAAIDPFNFSEEQLIHFDATAKLLGGKLTVMFLENIVGEVLSVAPPFHFEAYPTFSYQEIDWKVLEEKRKIIREKVNLYHTVCRDRNIDANLHEEEGTPLQETIKESRFADLLMINNDATLATLPGTDPLYFVKDVLRDAQCPVLVVPSPQQVINEIVFTYNGTYSSMYAIRQLTSLSKNIANKKVTVLYVDEDNTSHVEEEALLKEYLRHHYSNWEIKILRGDPPLEITSYLLHKPGCLVTMGAYGRSKFSHFFHRSSAETLLHALNVYAFITHP
jgi:nucleotide-binding universal stress UspA family protein